MFTSTKTKSSLARRHLGALLLLAASAAGVQAQEVKRLRVADSFPTGHYLSRLLLQPWMAEVTKRTEGKIQFDYFPGQQLGKAADMLTLTQNGVTDIGYVAPGYVSDKMASSEVAMLPGAFNTSCEGTNAYWKVARDGLVQKVDYAPNKIKLLLTVLLPPYQIMTIKQPITSIEDIKGVKLRTTGGAQDLTIRALGGVPVRMAAPDAYESLSRGTIDGMVFPLDSVTSYNLEKLLKHSTQNANFSSFVIAYSISDAAWAKLDPKVQQIMQDVAETTVKEACAAVDKQDAETRTKLQQAGVAFKVLDAPVLAKFNTVLAGVSDQWAQGLDGRNKQGSAVLKEFRETLATQSKK